MSYEDWLASIYEAQDAEMLNSSEGEEEAERDEREDYADLNDGRDFGVYR